MRTVRLLVSQRAFQLSFQRPVIPTKPCKWVRFTEPIKTKHEISVGFIRAIAIATDDIPWKINFFQVRSASAISAILLLCVAGPYACVWTATTIFLLAHFLSYLRYWASFAFTRAPCHFFFLVHPYVLSAARYFHKPESAYLSFLKVLHHTRCKRDDGMELFSHKIAYRITRSTLFCVIF